MLEFINRKLIRTVPHNARRILLVVATHTASCDSATVAEAGVCSVS
jgi:hypothetical protein